MKKYLAYAFTALTAMAMTCACGGTKQGNGKGADSLTFDSIKVDTLATLTDKEDSPVCSMKISFAFAKGTNTASINQTILKSGVLATDFLGGMDNATDMKAVVDTFVTRFIRDYRQTNTPLYSADRDSHSLCAEYDVTSHVSEGRKGIMVYDAEIYQYAGGAHGQLQTVVCNIDVQQKRVLTLKDILVPGGETKIKELIIEKMMKTEGVRSFKALQEKCYFMDMEAYVPDNFILDKDQLVFIYNSDEIAPHAFGQIRVVFDYDDIKKLMK
ncbi:MAG: RsiV family protein [Prevotella sp.]|nr:RsiV family protein [Prevotella sp.]MDD7045838.1 RsiV family protein [Prevotella sp.]MDY5546595.1 RsiV family protein [Prevotella sp.]